MKNIITKEYAKKIQFFQMPKAFFTNKKYTSMRCESKLGYMLMLDLLPLSIENNWVNQAGQVFVKLSRAKLMKNLNIKGTQKAAQVIKELEDKDLIISKRSGARRCNKIFLSLPEGPPIKASKAKVEVKLKDEDKEAKKDMEDIQLILNDQIHLDDLKLRYDPDFIDEIANNICEMYLSETTQIGKQEKPRSIIRNNIEKLEMHHIEHVIDKFSEVTVNTKIFNHRRYIQAMI